VAIGITADGKRRVLGVSVALSEAEVHWRTFLDSLIGRGLRGVKLIVSDDHAGLKAARRPTLPSVPWQRCQFHCNRTLRPMSAASISASRRAEDQGDLTDVLKRMVSGQTKRNQLDTLLPWNWKQPDDVAAVNSG
jgi:transposase-like protein